MWHWNASHSVLWHGCWAEFRAVNPTPYKRKLLDHILIEIKSTSSYKEAEIKQLYLIEVEGPEPYWSLFPLRINEKNRVHLRKMWLSTVHTHKSLYESPVKAVNAWLGPLPSFLNSFSRLPSSRAAGEAFVLFCTPNCQQSAISLILDDNR